MFFFFTFGTQDFSSALKGYEDMVIMCQHCHNPTARPIKRRNFFTFCFVPIIPLKWTEQIYCDTCRRHWSTSKEELDQVRANPPIQHGGQPAHHGGYPTQFGGSAGLQSPQPPHSHYAPGAPQEPMQYK